MEAADDAPLSYLGFPDKILTYSTLKSWFLQTTPKALVLSSFITILIIILFLETLFLYPLRLSFFSTRSPVSPP